MAKILDSLSKIQRGDVVMSVRDIKRTFVEGGQPLHILRGGGFDLHRGEIIALNQVCMTNVNVDLLIHLIHQ